MKIGIDIDDVVAEFTKEYVRFYNEKNGTDFKVEDMYSHDLRGPLNTTEENVIKIMFDFFKTEMFWDLELVDGVKELISELSKNHEIFFVTARSVKTKEKTKLFLEKQFPEIPINVFHVGDYFEGNKTKAEICEEQGIDFLIEDNQDYAFACADKGIKVFLLEKPWNKNHEGHPNIVKINHLKEVLEQIK